MSRRDEDRPPHDAVLDEDADDTVFAYAIAPAQVFCSDPSATPPRWNTVPLTITVENRTGRFVACPRIVFTCVTGAGATALTPDPSTIVAGPGSRTPWFIGGGADRWVALPLPPATGLDAGERISFTLDRVVIDRVPGQGTISIEEQTDRIGKGSIAVTKAGLVPHGDTPRIGVFRAAPEEVGHGGFVQLSWSVADAVAAEVLPGPIRLPDPAGGTLTVPVESTTVFRLRATGSGGRAEADATVAVAPVAVDSFTADPVQSAGPGEQVRLNWSTRFASQCAVDHGIGPVPTSGSVPVNPDRTTVYTLTASGREPQSAAVTVVVPRPVPGSVSGPVPRQVTGP